MEDILYINSVTNIKVKEMVDITQSTENNSSTVSEPRTTELGQLPGENNSFVIDNFDPIKKP